MTGSCSSRDEDSLDRLRARLADLGVGAGRGSELEFVLALLDTARVIVLVLDRDARIVYVNSFFEDLAGYASAELEGKDWFDTCVPADVVASVRPVFEAAIAGTATEGNVNPIRCQDGSERIVEWYDRTLTGDGGRISGLLSIGHDVTDRVQGHRALQALNETLEARVEARTNEMRRAQRELERSLQLLEGSFDASTVALAYLDRDFKFQRVNEAYAKTDGKTPEYFVGKDHFELFPNPDNERIFRRVRDEGEPYSVQAKPFEYVHAPERGLTHWDWTLTPVKGEGGDVTGLVLALRDVTERVDAISRLQHTEAQISQQLAEKEVLLHEIHHRVKNNLQIVSSLLYLQASKSEDSAVRRMFGESRDRVRAMSLVHETLYTADDYANVQFAPYLRKLADALLASYARLGVRVEVEVDVRASPMSIDYALPCGLIVSELVTNALKYAFVGRDEGRIWVEVFDAEPDSCHLRVRDDGVGLPPGELESTQTLGLTLVRSLVEQIGGRLEVARSGGASFEVRFPCRHADDRPPAEG